MLSNYALIKKITESIAKYNIVMCLVTIARLQLRIKSDYNTAQITRIHTSLLNLLQPPLAVAWLQSSMKGYSSHPCSLRTALTNCQLKTILLCP
jgi:hypothetical protein